MLLEQARRNDVARRVPLLRVCEAALPLVGASGRPLLFEVGPEKLFGQSVESALGAGPTLARDATEVDRREVDTSEDRVLLMEPSEVAFDVRADLEHAV